MKRIPDLIDVWSDSGAMPYTMVFPFENKEIFCIENFPADFIAEGVDQTAGWFYTLHALGFSIKRICRRSFEERWAFGKVLK